MGRGRTRIGVVHTGQPRRINGSVPGGAGCSYLLRHVAAGDAVRPGSAPLADYYAATGCPAGRGLGAGLAGLERLGEPWLRPCA